MNLPETDSKEDLYDDYPPRIICKFFPKENAPKETTCTISLSGLLPHVEVHIPLKAPTMKFNQPIPKNAVDTSKLEVLHYFCVVESFRINLINPRRIGGLGYSSLSVLDSVRVCVCRSVWVTW